VGAIQLKRQISLFMQVHLLQWFNCNRIGIGREDGVAATELELEDDREDFLAATE